MNWQPIETCPKTPTDDTWRIVAYCPGQSREVAELWRNQQYEGAEWHWSTPAWAGRGLLVLWESISHWAYIPEPPQ